MQGKHTSNERITHHLYANDKQAYVDTPVSDLPTAHATLQGCILDIGDWCSSRRLQLNETKTELILFGSKKFQKVSWTWQSAPTSSSQWSRSAILASNWTLSFWWRHTFPRSPAAVSTSCVVCVRLHVSSVRKSQLSWFPLSYFPGWTTVTVLAGLPPCTTEPLQRVLNAAARLVLNLRLRDHVTPALKQLHWLPIDYRITYKLCLKMHLVHTKHAPQYLSDSVQTVAHSSSRPGLRSSNTAVYAKPRCRTKFGEHGFSHARPTAWNSLPHHLHQISDTGLFKCRLKTELFRRAYVASC